MNYRVLCLEPFGGGSHAAFWSGWSNYSRHELSIVALPPVHWKWRSRHASLTLALEANERFQRDEEYEVVICSEMLNLPEWKGLVSQQIRALPCIAYFHENQFTYPLSPGERRDYHFAYSNLLTAIAADQVWFNSAFHRNEFHDAALKWLRRMPDYKHLEQFENAIANSKVLPPGIDPKRLEATCISIGNDLKPARTTRRPPVIGWVARWEHDKRPDIFAEAIEQLVDDELEFELILLGQQFASKHESLTRLEKIATGRIRHIGFVDSLDAYWDLLREIDIVVSTADHEFFGIGIVECVAAGAVPLLPNRLAYPEVFRLEQHPERERFLYDDFAGLLSKLKQFLERFCPTRSSSNLPMNLDEYFWQNLARHYDDAIQECVQRQ